MCVFGFSWICGSFLPAFDLTRPCCCTTSPGASWNCAGNVRPGSEGCFMARQENVGWLRRSAPGEQGQPSNHHAVMAIYQLQVVIFMGSCILFLWGFLSTYN